MNDDISNQNSQSPNTGGQDSTDSDLVPALAAMLERRADSAQGEPNLDAVRADALHGGADRGGSTSDRFGRESAASRRRPYQVALAAAALLIVGGGIIAISSRTNLTETGPTVEPNVGTAVDTTVGEAPADGGDGDESAITSTSSTTTTNLEETMLVPTSRTDGSTDSTVEGSPVNEAEQGLWFDYGDIVRVEQVDGVEWIWFDRSGFGEEQLQGPELTSEPRYELATDWHGGQNLNSRLRSYPLAPEVQVVQIDPAIIEQACGLESVSGSVFIESDVAKLLAANANRVSLTSEAQRRVTLVRDQMGC